MREGSIRWEMNANFHCKTEHIKYRLVHLTHHVWATIHARSNTHIQWVTAPNVLVCERLSWENLCWPRIPETKTALVCCLAPSMENTSAAPRGFVVNPRNKSQDISTGDSTLLTHSLAFKQLAGTEVMNRQTKMRMLWKETENEIAPEQCWH